MLTTVRITVWTLPASSIALRPWIDLSVIEIRLHVCGKTGNSCFDGSKALVLEAIG